MTGLAVLTAGADMPLFAVHVPAAVLVRLPIFLQGWHLATTCTEPRAVVVCTEAGSGFTINAPVLPGGQADASDPFAAADIAAAALTALAVSAPGVILPHAGAAESGEGLVLMLADTMAGKSTLALTMASRGWRLFGDDRVGLSVTAEGSVGLALGLAPKLRLPLPPHAAGLAAFAQRRRSLATPDLTFLALAPEEQAPPGASAKVAACLILNRRGGRPKLAPAPAPFLVRALAESAAAPWLSSAELLAQAVVHAALPAYHLSYGEAEEAAEILVQRFRRPT